MAGGCVALGGDGEDGVGDLIKPEVARKLQVNNFKEVKYCTELLLQNILQQSHPVDVGLVRKLNILKHSLT